MITLLLGGARSGKSDIAEGLVADAATVTYVATGAVPDPDVDPDWAIRIQKHRARRPASWRTVEVRPGGDLAGAVVAATTDAVLVDSLGTWVAGAPAFAIDADALCAALVGRRDATGPTVVVSEEVGLGVHPETALGVVFRDALGDVNRSVADVADEVLLVIAGRVVNL